MCFFFFGGGGVRLVWGLVLVKHPGQQFFSYVGTEPLLPGYLPVLWGAPESVGEGRVVYHHQTTILPTTTKPQSYPTLLYLISTLPPLHPYHSPLLHYPTLLGYVRFQCSFSAYFWGRNRAPFAMPKSIFYSQLLTKNSPI